MCERGYALPSVLIILTMLFGAATLMLGAVNVGVEESGHYADHQYAVVLAKTGFEEGASRLEQDKAYSGASDWRRAEAGQYRYEVTKVSDQQWGIAAWGQAGRHEKKLAGTVSFDPVTGELVAEEYKLVLE